MVGEFPILNITLEWKQTIQGKNVLFPHYRLLSSEETLGNFNFLI
jgi:hypothetical protein